MNSTANYLKTGIRPIIDGSLGVYEAVQCRQKFEANNTAFPFLLHPGWVLSGIVDCSKFIVTFDN